MNFPNKTGRGFRIASLCAVLAGALPVGAAEEIIGGPCEGCEYVFVGMPTEIATVVRIAPADEAGEQLILQGVVTEPDGTPAAGIVVYAYHTNAKGIYPRGETRHGRLRAWARTDDEGNYRFETIRPAAYPGQSIPQYIHMHIIEPGRVTYWIGDVEFDDDPLLSDSARRRAVNGRGGSGLVQPTRDAQGTWHARRDIVLGLHVPDYPCARKWTFPVPFHQSVSWSPDGEHLAFSAVTTSWDDGYRIFVARADGSELRQLDPDAGSDAPGSDAHLYPVWSPDGSQLAFASRRAGNSDILVMSADGTDVVQLTTHEANDSYPSWSPDGKRLVFHSNRDGNYELYVMNADGSGQRRITDHPADDYNPAWSPDGTRIAFDSDRDDVEGDEVYVVAPDGSGLTRVASAGVFPSWSPDGRHIAFAEEGLFVVNADGSGRRQLLEHAVAAAWSPDGKRLVAAAIDFDDSCRDQHRLVTVSAAGGQVSEVVVR